MEFCKSKNWNMIRDGNDPDTEDNKIVKTAQDSTKDMTVSNSQTNKRKGRYMTNSTAKNIKEIAINSTKRLIYESMFVQLLRATLHKDVLKPRNI